MNLTALRSRVRSLSGIRLDSIRTDAEIDQLINESYQEILGLFSWPFLRSEATVYIAAEANTFRLPSSFRYLNSVVVDEKRLSQTTMDELDRLESSIGDPQLYARMDDRTVVVWPAPDERVAVMVRGQREFEPLDEFNDTPMFAEQFHPAIAYRAASRLLSEEGDDSGRAEAYQLDAGGYVQRMQEHYISSNDVSLIRIGSRRGR